MRLVQLALILVISLASSTWAVPVELTYQGRLTDDQGSPLASDTATVRFDIFAAATGGSALMGTTQIVQTDVQGVFTTTLSGSAATFNGTTRYLQLTVRGTVLTPRQPLNTAPYSFRAGSVDGGVITNAALADDAVTDVKILDEPGIAQGRLPGSVTLGTSGSAMTTITQVTITIPTSGYVYLHGRSYYGFTGGTSGQGFLQINDAPDAGATGGVYSLVTSVISNSNWLDINAQRTYFKSAGTHTFYLAGYENYTGTVTAGYAILTAMFFPTGYGTVTEVASSADADLFSEAKEVLQVGGAVGAPDMATSRTHEVDLRDLEIKALKAEAAARAARETLEEAQSGVGQEQERKCAHTITGATR